MAFADQVNDIIWISTMFILREFQFAAVYLISEILPALIIMWNKYNVEESWKVLVNIKICCREGFGNLSFKTNLHGHLN